MAGAATLPSDPGRRTSAPEIEVWDLWKVGPLSSSALHLPPAAAAGLATTALQTGSKEPLSHLFTHSIPWFAAKSFLD